MLLGQNELAKSEYRSALRYDRNLVDAHAALSKLKLPGPDYYAWLDWFHTTLSPKTVIEIGIGDGASLARVNPQSLAIAVDPSPLMKFPLRTEAHVFAETSDEFFAKRRPDSFLAGQPVDLGFIDGLHLYEQALRDFIHLETYCGPRSIVLFHDTLPLDEPTQSRARDTHFHTGDVWKTVLCLKTYRPDLDIFTIATQPSGLTVVTGLDRHSHILADAYEEAVKRFISLPYSEIENREQEMLSLVPNDWAAVEVRLKTANSRRQ
jgi:hypothetical protein